MAELIDFLWPIPSSKIIFIFFNVRMLVDKITEELNEEIISLTLKLINKLLYGEDGCH